ncbi:hypothetical protein E0F88_08885 [Dyadobacter psychrotolerans]|uniref:Guanylate cyclase domain-containing protein n=2 Tax=Dyadobacter psychrotolerans TaxID=2541721 RepID=A0A4R5DYT1_9BACT|nr:hypothetical protein E0F88_08885 [Dyadobacter psychrotolerans]
MGTVGAGSSNAVLPALICGIFTAYLPLSASHDSEINMMMIDLINNEEPFKAFALLADINSYTKIVAVSEAQNNRVAKYISDILIGGVMAVEKNNGLVVGFAGDQFLALFKTVEEVYMSVHALAKDLDEICEYIAGTDSFIHVDNGIKIKVAIEFGQIDLTSISTKFLGTQKLFAGSTINYASRILNAGEGNRCNVGPSAYKKGLSQYIDSDRRIFEAKDKIPYEYYNLDFDGVWRNDHMESYWG